MISNKSTTSKGQWALEEGLPQQGDCSESIGSGIGFFGELRKLRSSNLGRVVVEDVAQAPEDHDNLHAPERNLGWKTVAMIQIGDVVGIGILTLGAAFAQLGWFLSIFLMCLMLPLNIYMGVILSEAREIFPAALNYREMARFTIGKQWFVNFVSVIFYAYVTAALGGYVLAMGDTIGEFFYDTKSCGPILSAISAAILLLPMQLRTLGEAKPLMWLNSFCIVLSVTICLGYMLANMSARSQVKTTVWPNNIAWYELVNGFSKICFAFLGAYIYLEVMSEMKQPTQFPKAFSISGPFQLAMYLFAGIVSYEYNGENAADSIVRQIDPENNAALLRVACVALFIHLIISFLIKGTILCRSMHLAVSPDTVNDNTLRARGIWFMLSLCLIVCCYTVANSVPLFGKLVSILGGFAGPLLGYIFPIIFLHFARRHADVHTSKFEFVMLGSIFIFAVVLIFVALPANIISLLSALEKTQTAPFSCT